MCVAIDNAGAMTRTGTMPRLAQRSTLIQLLLVGMCFFERATKAFIENGLIGLVIDNADIRPQNSVARCRSPCAKCSVDDRLKSTLSRHSSAGRHGAWATLADVTAPAGSLRPKRIHWRLRRRLVASKLNCTSCYNSES